MAASDAVLYEKFIIESTDGKRTADIKEGVVFFSYFENVFSPHLTAKVQVSNTGSTIEGEDGVMTSLYNGLPLVGGERVIIKVSGNSATNKGLKFDTPEKYFYVSSITNILIDGEREAFTLNLVSREAITNETVRVGKRFPTSQKISDSVEDICKNYLSSDKLYDNDETENPYGFIGNMKKPFTILTWLASKSVPSKVAKGGSTAGYFFFETQKGFRYKSVDQLIDQDPYEETYVYTPGIVEYKGPNNDFKILEYSTEKNQNLLDNLERGAFCSHRKYINPLTFEYTPSPKCVFKLDDYSGKMKNLGGDINVTLPTLSDKDSRTLASVPSRYITGFKDIGTIENDVSFSENADASFIHSQAMMRYNTLFTQLLVMTVPLNTNLIAGDIIKCQFPRTDNEERKEIDRNQSGLYMIKELVHYFDASGSYTKLKLVRDTFGERET